MTESIGARLRRLREERGLSQRDISSAGVSYTYVSRIESGQRQPSVKALRLLAAKLGVGSEYLETGRELPPESDWDLRLRDAELQLRLDDPVSAERRFHELLEELEVSGDSTAAARARVGLALAAERQGRHEEAVAMLERVLERERPPVGERPDLYAVLGRSYAAVGETPRAVALFNRCLDEIRASTVQDGVLFIRFASYLSYALTDIGDSVGAHQVLAEALGRSEGVQDRMTLIRLYWSLARYYSVEGLPARALDYVRRAIALLETTEDAHYLARAHEACATILLDQASPAAAREHLEVAERLFGELSEPVELGWVRTEWARVALLEGEGDTARAHALGALDLLEGGDATGIGRAWRTLADVFDRLADPDLAERCYRTGIEAFLRQGAARELAETYRAFGKFFRARGREKEALDAFERAADLAAHTVAVPAAEAVEPSRTLD